MHEIPDCKAQYNEGDGFCYTECPVRVECWKEAKPKYPNRKGR